MESKEAFYFSRRLLDNYSKTTVYHPFVSKNIISYVLFHASCLSHHHQHLDVNENAPPSLVQLGQRLSNIYIYE